MEHLHGQSFTWDVWSGGNLTEMLKIPNREETIIANSDVIRKNAIGWCKGTELVCRPKKDTVAVMFITNDIEWWTHLTTNEFLICFPEFYEEF